MATYAPTYSGKPSDNDALRAIISESDRAVAVQRAELDRSARNWRMYFAAYGEQWDEADRAVLRSQNRHIAQFDIISPKIEALAGALLADLPDISWTPVVGQKSIITEAVAESYHSDKELFNYEKVLLDVFRDGLVHAGDAYLDLDSRYGTDRICLKRELPGYLVWDPYWKTDDDRDAEIVYRFRYRTAAKLMETYNHKAEEILKAKREQEIRPSDYPAGGEAQRRQLQERVGDEYKVVEKHYLKRVGGKRLIGRRENSEQFIPFPVGKDREYLTRFAEVNEIDWTTVVETKYEDRVHYFSVVCEGLRVLIAEEQKSRVQVGGLPFFHFSPKRFDGRDMGIVEAMIDAQQTINKRESLVTEIISKASGGAMVVNQNLFPEEARRESWSKNFNKPGHIEYGDLDAIQKAFERAPHADFPSTAIDQISRMVKEMVPRVSRTSETLTSMTESGESGILFERKYQLNLIANTLLNRGIRQVVNNIGEAYFYQWQALYKDMSQTVEFRDGRRVTLNERGPGGLIFNAVAEVPRCNVIVTENTKSQTFQMRYRSMWAEVMKSFPFEAAPGHFFLILKKFLETLQLDEDAQRQLEMLNEMMMVKARVMSLKDLTALQTGIQGDSLQSLQLQQQIDMLHQQAMQPPQPGMGGMAGGTEPQGTMPVQLPPEGGAPVGMPDGGEQAVYDPRVDYTQTPEAARISDATQAAQMPAGQPMMA